MRKTLAKRAIKLEVCVDSVESALAAARGGADRVELCENLLEGGTTPSAGMIREARRRLRIGLHVMIRPRGGDFCYSATEFEVMKQDVRQARSLGADGVVFGILRTDGTVDVRRTRVLMKLAGGMSVTFHRAFDMTSDPLSALRSLMRLGVQRVLTSGQRPTARQGIELIRSLHELAGDRIIVMPGGGVERHLRMILRTGVLEVHLAAAKRVRSRMRYRNRTVHMGNHEGSDEYAATTTDAVLVRRLCTVLRTWEKKGK
ncbi:MAG: copper homeostasis protein CutC [Ignavibacteria bacterium]|nr:copper homeostasis protein CutC [Ignavibacteria bacterium]